MEKYIHWSFCEVLLLLAFVCVVTHATAPQLAAVDGKSLFRSLRASNCQVDCSSASQRPVCGTDGVTYPSRCELKRAKKCDGRRVKVRKKGHCTDVASGGGRVFEGGSKCLTERTEAMEAARHQTSTVFIPKCNNDGSFAEIQCHSATGYCWCVTREGRHISSTSVKDRRPRCGSKRSRRKRRKMKKAKRRKACTRSDHYRFNKGLVWEFMQEYNRIQPPSSTPSPKPTGSGLEVELEKRTVEWKFAQLDKDNDEILRYKEIRNFVKMVKKLIKPKACAKKFLKNCDRDNNRRIELKEWTLCLGIDTINRQTTEPPSDRVKPQDTKNCEQERDAALTNHHQEPNANIYIPRCQADGKWNKAQCHKATQYCWCVEEDTGMPIPGTSTQAVEPNCSITEDRPMKGCPFTQKRRFLVDLMSDLTDEMATNSSGIGHSGAKGSNLREIVAKWKLSALDDNSNGILERKEWKKLRKTNLKNKKYPRKCRRNFLRYCDKDSNQKVTLEEWKDCLGLNHNYNTLPGNNRKGKKNPFIDQLT